MNIISLKDKESKEVFRKTFAPSSLLIDSNTGFVNADLLLERDQVLGFNALLH